MAGWKIEAGRVFLYIFFPVAMFALYNEPIIYEATVMKFRDYMIEREKLEREEKEVITKRLNRAALDDFLARRDVDDK
uniref:Uncharacterized protein n=1 Tax=Tetranychus urticae TaxID=32264 RepID=T1K453_TETUR